ncbi:N-acetylmuramoyl-L-alanine amidase, partial [Streptococcus fryi]
MSQKRIIRPKKRWFVASAAMLTVFGGGLAEADSLQEAPISSETETSLAPLSLDANPVAASDLTTASITASAASDTVGTSASQGNYNVYNKVIFIDAGHGGADPGAVYENTTEKSLTLNMQSLVRNRLEAEGYSIVTARDDNSYVDLIDRSKKANMSQADLFVSIHFNAATTPTATGIEAYYYQYHKDYPSAINQTYHNDEERLNHSAVLANAIQSAVVSETGGKNNGVLRRTFAVLRETTAPAVLLELGYMSNSSELAKLKSPAYQQQLAKGIVDGIKKYYSYYGVSGSVVKQPVSQPVVSPPSVSGGVRVIQKTGTYTFTQPSAVKSEPKVHSATLATYQAGQRVNYDQVVQSDNHHWLSYLSYGGYRRYVSLGQVSSPQSSVPAQPTTTPEKPSTVASRPVVSSPSVSGGLKVISKTGTYTFTQPSAVKSEPKVHSATLATYQAGQRVNYDQ